MPEKLRNIFFQKKFVVELGVVVKKSYPTFDEERFKKLVLDKSWKDKELKERMHHVTECLHQTLPEEYPKALKILLKAAPSFKGFDSLVFPDYVEYYGQEHWDLSMPALKEFTKLCTSEFAVRPFLDQDPVKGMEYMYKWADDKHEAVRRLSTEGCRPRLPWAMALQKFKKDPSPIIPILEKLLDDKSETVRRSVANNINDISKDNPQIALHFCEKWHGRSDNVNRVIKHACRDMLKSGNKRAMILFGFEDPSHIQMSDLKLEKKRLKIGDDLLFSFNLIVPGKSKSKIRLEYIIHYVKSAGKLSGKVFQITENEFNPGTHNISRKRSFADVSTRKHFPGTHHITIIANGVEKASEKFDIT
jgi:3-methyladenine DNA glycosylase AlkC